MTVWWLEFEKGGVLGYAMNIGRVYTAPTFIAYGVHHCTQGEGARN